MTINDDDDDDDDDITNLLGRPSNGAQQRLTKCCKIKQEFVRPRWPYDMRPSARAVKYMCVIVIR